AICAFWGLARLAELTYDNEFGDTKWINSVWCSDVTRTNDTSNSLTLHVRGAKTAKAGVAQHILLNGQPSYLCPVEAIKRRLRCSNSARDSLFGYVDQHGTRHNLTRSAVAARCARIWEAHGWTGISGHSFRVGGASLRAALG
ncbi:hypothetical protein DFH28DRAFT_876263, partial [Melampsora americana]